MNTENTTEIKRFPVSEETKVLKALSKFFDEEGISEEEAMSRKDAFVYDNSNVCLVSALSEEARRVLSRFMQKEDKRTLPEFEYSGASAVKVKVSSEYLNMAINLFKIFEDAVLIEAKTDFPITLSNKHFKIIIAPRVET